MFYSVVKEILLLRTSLRYVVFEYQGQTSKHFKTLLNRLRVIVDSSILFSGQGGVVTPVLSVLPASDISFDLEGWIVADNIYETSIVWPGWAGYVSIRTLPPPRYSGVRYVILRGYLGEGVGSYPRQWLRKLAAQLISEGVEAVLDWRLVTTMAAPLPAISVGGFVVQPIVQGLEDPGEASSLADARLFDEEFDRIS